MRADGAAEVQHYVPQLLLRLHANEQSKKKGSEQVWCFDKKTDKIFSPNIKRILAESRFNEIEIDDKIVSLEAGLTRLETQTAPLIERILESRSVDWIGEDDREILSCFLAVQFAWTAAFRDEIRGLSKGFEEALRKHGVTPENFEGFPEGDDDADDIRMAFNFVQQAPQTFAPHLFSKHWCLLGSVAEDPFHLGDHPVVRENEFGRERGLGLASHGVTIYMPLSPTVCLSLMDPSVVRELKDGLRKGRRLAKKTRKLLRQPGDPIIKARIATGVAELDRQQTGIDLKTLPMIRGHMPIPYDPQVAMRVNSLQMRFASRWVVSSKNDFSLAQRMIADNEAFRNGVGVRLA